MDTRQKQKYNRHIILPQIGEEGQKKLANAKVLVVGAGGLGAPVLFYLVAAGIGTIGIVDHDSVNISNLQRQILYKEHQCGGDKVFHAKEALQELNPDTVIHTYPTMLTKENAKDIISDYDIVVGATDTFESRSIIDRVTCELGIPFVHGSICEFQGQVSVFNYANGPSYADLYPETPEESKPFGVIGVLPGIIGSMQANEVIKLILEIGEVLVGKLLIFDALTSESKIVEF